ncbi:hypothetical protein PI124_g9355 [Phytophthora idaei]|nr:hypothetical protein PI125_g22842 [Phytophthora idaei]KAG3245913.1 hypothetical protein PI124_g9355 [Phytophthora idaei]
MSKRLFLRVYEAVLQRDPDYFEQREDCTGKLGIHPMLKIASGLRVLGYGGAADMLGEKLELVETTISDDLRHFVDSFLERCIFAIQ